MSQVKAGDVMRSRVETIGVSMPVDEALRFLEEGRISGAPVVDPAGNVVGVLSLSDLAEAKEAEAEGGARSRGDYFLADPLDEVLDSDSTFYDKESYSHEILAQGTVADWMTQEVVWVERSASLKRVCRTMIDNGIHRVLVLEGGKLGGIVTTFDVVRFLAERG